MESIKQVQPLRADILNAIVGKIEGESEVGRTIDGEFQSFDGAKLEVVKTKRGSGSYTGLRVTLTDSERPAEKTGIQFPEVEPVNEHDRERFRTKAEEAIREAFNSLLSIEQKPVGKEHVERWAGELLTQIMVIHEQEVGGL